MDSNTNIKNPDNCVNNIFECEQQIEHLKLKFTEVDMELLLCDHLSRAFQLLERHSSKKIN